MKEYDYIITGSGASGLMLAYRMANDSFFDSKSILIIDKEKKSTNDRTWSFWEQGKGEWDDVVCKSWNHILFNSDNFSKKISLSPYSYKTIRSEKFYKQLWEVIESKENISFIEDTIINISHKSHSASVLTKKTEYHASKLFNSILFGKMYKQQLKYPALEQHFVGWFIETESDMFDDTAATFMDFAVQQRDNTRFMYVLPMSPRKALFEYTLFSNNLLETSEYEKEIERYLKQKSITKYTIVEKEKGIIPMTSYRFWKHNSKNVLNIGTAGGWSKASTGFTFMNINKNTSELIEFIKTGKSFREFRKKTRFWWYDLLLLDVLSKENHLGSKIFSKLFKRNSIQKIFKFLDERTSITEDISIFLTMSPFRFVKALFKRIF
ncbi:lycopene cyclase family protein [Pseudotenacibaculum sp. MALMAid0570]|uniref:lycopene cyclase family protein n=1 Tax=Pseudotenacibaculum sp. MALMAid0570 TaxID=3143938 RepID=UPI0032DFA501